MCAEVWGQNEGGEGEEEGCVSGWGGSGGRILEGVAVEEG